jgi:hypothetical protein
VLRLWKQQAAEKLLPAFAIFSCALTIFSGEAIGRGEGRVGAASPCAGRVAVGQGIMW